MHRTWISRLVPVFVFSLSVWGCLQMDGRTGCGEGSMIMGTWVTALRWVRTDWMDSGATIYNSLSLPIAAGHWKTEDGGPGDLCYLYSCDQPPLRTIRYIIVMKCRRRNAEAPTTALSAGCSLLLLVAANRKKMIWLFVHLHLCLLVPTASQLFVSASAAATIVVIRAVRETTKHCCKIWLSVTTRWSAVK